MTVDWSNEDAETREELHDSIRSSSKEERRQLGSCASLISNTFTSSDDANTYDTGTNSWSTAGRTFEFDKCTHKFADHANTQKVAECKTMMT